VEEERHPEQSRPEDEKISFPTDNKGLQETTRRVKGTSDNKLDVDHHVLYDKSIPNEKERNLRLRQTSFQESSPFPKLIVFPSRLANNLTIVSTNFYGPLGWGEACTRRLAGWRTH
jgi:hypothetical protein